MLTQELQRTPAQRSTGRCTTLPAWRAWEKGKREGLLLGPLRAPAAQGTPLPDEEVLDAPREGRTWRHLRERRASRSARGHGRGDTAGPRRWLPRKGRSRDAHR